MIIKPHVQAKIRCILLFVFVLIVYFVFFISMHDNNNSMHNVNNSQIEEIVFWLLVLGCLSLSMISAIMEFVKTYRTFIFTQEGVSVIFFKYQRKYEWNELKTKRLYNYKNFKPDSSIYCRGVEFSPKNMPLRKRLKPFSYHHMNPMSFIYVGFKRDDITLNFLKKLWGERGYEVDEKEFLGKLSEWGVILEKVGF